MILSQGRNAAFSLFFALALEIAHTQGLAPFLLSTIAKFPSASDAYITRYLAAGDTLLLTILPRDLRKLNCPRDGRLYQEKRSGRQKDGTDRGGQSAPLCYLYEPSKGNILW
jgi:hypothetical protein